MKKTHVFLLAALLLVSGASQAMPSSVTVNTPIAVRSVPDRTYAEGVQDGNARAAELAATYGYGTPEYQEAVAAEAAEADYLARNSEEPFYWRGYSHALRYY
jgi:hypothetical protein